MFPFAISVRLASCRDQASSDRTALGRRLLKTIRHVQQRHPVSGLAGRGLHRGSTRHRVAQWGRFAVSAPHRGDSRCDPFLVAERFVFHATGQSVTGTTRTRKSRHPRMDASLAFSLFAFFCHNASNTGKVNLPLLAVPSID